MKYFYKCYRCDNSFSVDQSMKDDSLTYCDKCDTENLYRVITGSALIFKGTGWACKNKPVKDYYQDYISDKTRAKLEEAKEQQKGNK